MHQQIFGVDIGGSKLICGILTPEGEILQTWRADYAPGYSADTLFDLIRRGFEKLNGNTCTVCGVAVPGLCDAGRGIWQYSPFSGISNIPVTEILHKMTGLPTYADNDVNLSAMAERYYGVCQGKDDFLWVTISNGIGGGLFLNGSLYRGANLTAGEIGHIIVEPNGRICGCGNHGCLEAMASGASISAIFRERTGQALSTKEISLLAQGENLEAMRVFEEAGSYIGTAAAHAVNLLGLDTVVLGGGVAESFSLLEPSATTALRKNTFTKANPTVKLLHSGLGKYAALTGCAALILNNKF